MSFLSFDPKVQSYQPAKTLLGPSVVNAVDPSQAIHPVAEKDEEHLSAQSEATRQQLSQAYRQDAGLAHRFELVITAEQIMTAPVISLSIENTVAEAKALFSQRRFRHVPVLDSQGRVLGMLSDRDLFHYEDEGGDVFVVELMTKNVLVAMANAGIRDIARTLFEQRIGAMPILDENHALTGMVTRSDILRTLVNREGLELWV